MKNNIHESVSSLLIGKLAKYKNSSLNSETCVSIYGDIFNCFVQIFEESNVKISNESMNLMSQLYYDSIKINNTHELDPNIFERKASVKNVETKELALLATMLKETPFAEHFILEIKKRS